MKLLPIVPGCRVIVIYSSREYDADSVKFPPVGAEGVVLTAFDVDRECDVLFSNYPCPVEDPSWVSHEHMIMRIDGGDFEHERLSEMERVDNK